ncbi:MAG: hypothetical protein ACXWL2_04195 [Candidatus Chromulinivorax sp.]
MMTFQSLIYFANSYLQIYHITDCIEILFFIFIIFKISTWLSKDYTKPLLLYFYTYFITLFTSYFFQLTTIYQLMLVSAPIYFILLIVQHQKNLQKNFILTQQKPLTPAKIMHKEWVENLIRACLVACHQKKNITCVIEQNDSLETLINKPFLLNISIQKQIIDLLLESVSFDIHKLILVDNQGTLMSINAIWSDLIMHELFFHQVQELELQKECAKIATTKSDAIIIHINSQHQLHFIAHQGKIIEHITIDQMLKLIKNILYKKDNDAALSQGINHDVHKNSSFSSIHKN